MKTRTIIIIGIILILGVIIVTDISQNYLISNTEAHPQTIQNVLSHCKQAASGALMIQPGIKYSNDTHYMDKNTCEWQKIENEN